MSGAEQAMAVLAASLPQGVLLEDHGHRLLLSNRAFLEVHGMAGDPDELSGRDVEEMIGDAAAGFVDPAEFVRVIRARRTDRVPVTGDELITVEGNAIERDYVPIDTGHLWIFRDVTKRKREEERLAEEYHRLIGVTMAKNRFVASVSHELRTPLTSIVSFSGLLSDPSSGPLTDEQREFLEIVERNGSRLIRLVGDLLMLSRLESGAVPLEMDDVDPGSVVLAAARGQQLSAADRGIDLQTRTVAGEPIVGDADRLGPTRSSSPRPAGGCRSPPCRTPRAGRSRSATPGSASRRRSRTGSSASSTGPPTRAATARPGPGWGWPSPS